MKCIDCGVGCGTKTLHRSRPLGETPADWRCIDCLQKAGFAKPDPETHRIAEIIRTNGKVAEAEKEGA